MTDGGRELRRRLRRRGKPFEQSLKEHLKIRDLNRLVLRVKHHENQI